MATAVTYNKDSSLITDGDTSSGREGLLPVIRDVAEVVVEAPRIMTDLQRLDGDALLKDVETVIQDGRDVARRTRGVRALLSSWFCACAARYRRSPAPLPVPKLPLSHAPS